MTTTLEAENSDHPRSRILEIAITFVSVVAAFVVTRALQHYWNSESFASPFFCAIICSAWFGGYSQSLLAIALSALAFDYWYLRPVGSFDISSNELPRFCAFLLCALLVGFLAASQRRKTASLQRARHDLAARNADLQRINELLNSENAQRRHAQGALQLNESYLAEAQRLSLTGSFGWHVSTGELVWSEETFRIFQIDPKTKPTVGLILQQVHPEDRDSVKQTIEKASQEGKDFDIEHRLLMPDGSVKYLHVVAHAERDESGKNEFVGAVMDVTVAKGREASLRRIETYFSEAQRLSHTGSWAWSTKTEDNLYWSREHYRIFGFDPDTDSGQYKVARERIHPDDVSAFDENVRRMMQGPIDYEIRFRVVLPSGEIRHIHTLGHPVLNNAGELVEYIGTTVDVTEQVKARVALDEAFSKIKNSEASLQAIIDTIPTLAWSTEPDGSVEFVNLRWRDFTGMSTEQARGSGWEAAIHPEDIVWLSEQRRISMDSGKPFELEARMRRYDGQYRWFINRADPLLDEQGKIVKWYGTNTDIDDRKQAEEALRRAQAKLTHVTRITTMGELTASIAHEVNQPLTAVVNNANASISLLPKDNPGLDEVRQALTEIVEDAVRASAVIARIRQLAKNAPLEKTLLDLRDVVTDVMALARHESANRRATIQTDLPTEQLLVIGDRVQLQQVLLNLVANGMDAMNSVEESDRILKIRGGHEAREGRLEALVSVQDAGIGFKTEETDQLFEAFYTTKSQGMGMGLAISRSIIEAHGGRLWAEPNKGPGATFCFSLPGTPGPLGKGELHVSGVA